MLQGGAGWQLTVELDDVEPGALEPGPAAGLLDEEAVLGGLALVAPQRPPEREGDDGQHDSPAAVRPAPVVVVEVLGRLGAGEGGDDVRRRRERKGQASIPHRRRVGCDDVHGENHAGEAHRVEDLQRGSVSARIARFGKCADLLPVRRSRSRCLCTSRSESCPELRSWS